MRLDRRSAQVRPLFFLAFVLQGLELLQGLLLNGKDFFLSGFQEDLHFPRDTLHVQRQFRYILARGTLVEFYRAIDFVLRKRVSISPQINAQQVVPIQRAGDNNGHFGRHAIYDGLAFRVCEGLAFDRILHGCIHRRTHLRLHAGDHLLRIGQFEHLTN